ncbi:MAG: DUF1501 domain-containing protein [Bacteroidia bacterium]
MEKISRRKFLGTSALVSGALMMPKFLKAFEKVGTPLFPQSDKTLVIVQLSGGNDGLNCVIPYRQDQYYSLRPVIGIPRNNVLKLNDDLGLNPSLMGLRKIFDDGNLCIINSVGYPNPDLSHFRSMDIWQTASGSDQYKDTGWIGRYLDAACPDCSAYKAIEADHTLSLALKGEKISGFAISDPVKLYRSTKDPYLNDLLKQLKNNETPNSNNEYLYKVMRETFSAAEYVYDKSKIYHSQTTYPKAPFSGTLKTIAELITSGCETKVYYTSLTGFDSHVGQLKMQERALKIIDESLLSFTTDLKQNNKLNDVMIMVFSEFGRRASQNASGGTDHGTANNIWMINGALRKNGFYNEAPDLSNLDEGGNLKMKMDFRNVYATVLKKWLGANDELILGNKFEQLNFV